MPVFAVIGTAFISSAPQTGVGFWKENLCCSSVLYGSPLRSHIVLWMATTLPLSPAKGVPETGCHYRQQSQHLSHQRANQEMCLEKDYICGPNEPKRGALWAARCVFTAIRHVNPWQRILLHSIRDKGRSINLEIQPCQMRLNYIFSIWLVL